MRPVQKLLFADPRPLVERLGAEYFRNLPERPGVYFMQDVARTVLYVGKARNLRQRLRSYRVANPDRLPRRHLRLLSRVAHIELEECADERAALARESELLRTLRPPFNRAGTWSPPPRFFAWRCQEEHLEFRITAMPEPGWQSCGPLKGSSVLLCPVLARLLWITLHPGRGYAALPVGWSRGRSNLEVSLGCGVRLEEVVVQLEAFLSGKAAEFTAWVRGHVPAEVGPFERAALDADLEQIADGLPVLDRAESPS